MFWMSRLVLALCMCVSVCVCVCVCTFPIYLVTIPLIKARRVLHFAVSSEDYTLQRTFLSFSTNRGHTGGGEPWGFFTSLCSIYLAV